MRLSALRSLVCKTLGCDCIARTTFHVVIAGFVNRHDPCERTDMLVDSLAAFLFASLRAWTTGSKPGGEPKDGSRWMRATPRLGAKEGLVLSETPISGPVDARRVAGAAAPETPRHGNARAMRSVGIVPLLREQTVPPRTVVLRQRSIRMRATALASAGEKAQDVAQSVGRDRSTAECVIPTYTFPATRHRRSFRRLI